jgi:hypothetical protein
MSTVGNTERDLTNHIAKIHPDTWDDLQDDGVVLELANGE